MKWLKKFIDTHIVAPHNQHLDIGNEVIVHDGDNRFPARVINMYTFASGHMYKIRDMNNMVHNLMDFPADEKTNPVKVMVKNPNGEGYYKSSGNFDLTPVSYDD